MDFFDMWLFIRISIQVSIFISLHYMYQFRSIILFLLIKLASALI